MFEFDKYTPTNAEKHSQPTDSYSFFTGGKKRALLLWGEHCIECAAPDCFETCDLYQARPDERCRRFEYGIFRNKSYPSATGYGAEVIFRQWGKLEARGNATLLPSGLSYTLETVIYLVLPLLNGLGKVARRLGAGIRWSYISFGVLERLNKWLLRRRSTKSRPDAFVAEIYNPTGKSETLKFSISIDTSQLVRNLMVDRLPRSFSQKLTIEPGYNRFDIDASNFMSILESGLPFGMVITPENENANLVFLTLDLIEFQDKKTETLPTGPENTQFTASAKCVVFDLDNTLWDGILLEGNVRLRSIVPKIFAELDSRGIIVSIASKNAHEDAIAKLDELDLAQYLVYPMINWEQKSKNLQRIADAISIGIDSIIFVDDNPFEREEVSKSHPKVETLPDTALGSLLDHPRLVGSKTAESSQRRIMYQQQIEREEIASSFGEDYLSFLKTCEIVVAIAPLTPEHTERAIELVQRTNQLNFSGRKYSREEIMSIIDSDELSKFVISCQDKFGSYGVVGFALARWDTEGVHLEDFMLSCRVQGKFIEQAFFHYLVTRTQPESEVISINFLKTDRNGLAQAVLEKLGFSFDEKAGKAQLHVGVDALKVDFMEVNT